MATLSGLLQVTRSMRSPTLIRSHRWMARRWCRLVTSRSTASSRSGISDSQFTNAIIYEFSPLL